jgi:hypothetical protein
VPCPSDLGPFVCGIHTAASTRPGGLAAPYLARPAGRKHVRPACSLLCPNTALQSPSVAAVGLFARNEIGVCYTLCWWTVNYCPGGAWAAVLPPVRTAAKLLRAILRATTVVQRVNAAVMLHPGVIAAPLVLGTLSACGGGLLVDAFSHCAGYSVKGD